jgi:predicted SAM-dependent methyltransferase
MGIYTYQLKDAAIDFVQGVRILQESLPNRVFVGYPEITHSHEENEELLQLLREKGLATGRIEVDKEEYAAYLEKAGYKEKYPNYYSSNFQEKSLEHFIAFTLLDLKEIDVFIDIAAEHSPHAEIFSRLTGCKSYMQDIMFEEGIHGNKIGGDASKLPLDDHSCTGVLAAYSIEHFEGNADVLFMKEMSRVLDIVGRVVILPLYLHKKPFCITDPRYSIPGNVEFDAGIDVHCIENWGNRHGRFYSPETLYARLIEPNLSNMRFMVFYVKNFKTVHESVYCRFALVAEKI